MRVAANDQVSPAMLTRVVRMASMVVGNQHMAPGGAALLRQTARVLRDDALALDVGGRAQQLADGDDARAAHARHHDAPDACHLPDCMGGMGSGKAPRLKRWTPPLSLAFFLSWPPSTVTKLGQKPFTQLMSLLQVLWLMVRLRPNSVSSGSTLRQLDCTPQSPQPSHTSSLMTTRLAGSTMVPRLRRRRFSVAQVWS
jgi:hypothetical protein